MTYIYVYSINFPPPEKVLFPVNSAELFSIIPWGRCTFTLWAHTQITSGYLARFVAFVRPKFAPLRSQTSDTRQPLYAIAEVNYALD